MKKIRLDGYVGTNIRSDLFADELKSAAGDDIEITLNSEGGNVFQAFDIFQQMQEYQGQVVVKLGGIVASAGTVISSGADKIVASPISSFMIHNAHAFVDGDYKDLEDASKMLRRINQHMAVQYAKISGKTEKEVYALMDAETWMFGTEIKSEGFAHEITDGNSAVDIPKALVDARASYEKCKKEFQEKPLSKKDIPVSIINVIEKPKKEKKVDRTEAVNFVKADMKPAEIAAAFNLKLADEAKEIELTAVKAENESLKKTISDGAEALRLAKIQAMYPGKDSPMAAYLTKITAGLGEKEVQAVFDGLKDDPVAKAITAKVNDQDSELNIIDAPAGMVTAEAANTGTVEM